MVSGNVNWYPIGQPAAGCLVLFEKPKGQLGGVSCHPNKSRGSICFDATRKCPGNVRASIWTTLAVRNIVFINHHAWAHPLKLDYGSSCRWRWVLHFSNIIKPKLTHKESSCSVCLFCLLFNLIPLVKLFLALSNVCSYLNPNRRALIWFSGLVCHVSMFMSRECKPNLDNRQNVQRRNHVTPPLHPNGIQPQHWLRNYQHDNNIVYNME